MARFLLSVLPLCLLLSCARPASEPVAEPVLPGAMPLAAPAAVLRAGEYPLWFQFSGTGPVLIDSIEDARFSAALIPWPLAPHIRRILARGDELLMAVNRYGFLRLAPRDGAALEPGGGGIGLFHISGGEFWRHYTVGAFVLFEGKPAALLYRDDRFLDSGAELPRPRLWTFRPETAEPEGLDIPALDQFPPQEGWNVDTLRLGPDGFWYYRVMGMNGSEPDIRLFRTERLSQTGEAVSIADFQNSALPESLSAAPAPLGKLLNAALARTGGASVLVISPDFPQQRFFAESAGAGPGLLAYYRSGPEPPLAVAILPGGQGMYLTLNSAADPELRPFTLPPLPEGFVYTGIGIADNDGDAVTLFAAWEEQEEYSIGAAGFMVIQKPLTALTTAAGASSVY